MQQLILSGIAQVDIYSFGVLLWELVTAIPPIRGRLRSIKVSCQPACVKASIRMSFYAWCVTCQAQQLQPCGWYHSARACHDMLMLSR